MIPILPSGAYNLSMILAAGSVFLCVCFSTYVFTSYSCIVFVCHNIPHLFVVSLKDMEIEEILKFRASMLGTIIIILVSYCF